MKTALVCFWTALTAGSIAWYGFLVFYIGIRAGREIGRLTKTLGRRGEGESPPR